MSRRPPFRRMRHGQGWAPASPAGWALLLGWGLVLVAPAVLIGGAGAGAGAGLAAWLVWCAVLTAGLVVLMRHLAAGDEG